MGSPYVEDYYYQAFVYKHYNKRNKRSFAPESGGCTRCGVQRARNWLAGWVEACLVCREADHG